ncbi:MAG TPA: hypothetical protein VEH51_08660 [Burkholderiales bacterium]|nr:hypothetical protein [Burkholderiales bacterium]
MKPSYAARLLCRLMGAAMLAATGASVGAQPPTEGKYDFTACWSGTSDAISFSKSHVAYTYDLSGANLSNPPGGMFDHVDFHCIGLATVFAGKVMQTTLCEGVDPDGDKTLTRFDEDGQHGKRVFLEGTGKYAGMVSTGTQEPLGKFVPVRPGTFQGCNRQTGTYKMRAAN